MTTLADMDTLLEIAGSLLEQGELRDSLSAFDEVLTRQPDSVPALLGSAAALVQLGAPEQAYRYVDLAIGLAPESAAVWRTATSVALAAGDGPMAKRAATRRLEMTADGIEGLLDLAIAAMFDLDYPLARDAAAEAVRVEPQSEVARFWHEKLASIASEQQWLVEVGRAHCRRGRFARGLELFDRALDLGDSYDAHLYAGRALIALGEPEAAMRELGLALELAPQDAEAASDLELARSLEAHAPRATGPAPAPATAAGAGTAPRAAAAPAPTRPAFCWQCGNRLVGEAAFCVACGAKM